MYKFARTMYRLFQGRIDTYALQRIREGKLAYFRVEGKEITPDNYFQHLNGDEVLGIYPLRLDGTTSFACVDMDTSDLNIVAQVRALCPSPNYLEKSRSGNYHLWLFFAQPVPADTLLTKLQPAIALGSTLIAEDHCGLYPLPQPRGTVGVLIALPLQAKAVAQQRSVFVNETGEPYPDQYAFVAQMEMITVAHLNHFAQGQVSSALDDHDVLKIAAVYDLYVGRNKKTGDQTSSGYDYAFCVALADNGCSMDQALKLLCQRPNVHSTNKAYLNKTVAAGFAFSEKKKLTILQKQLKGDVGGNGNGTGAGVAGTDGDEVITAEESWTKIAPISRQEYLDRTKEVIIFYEEQRRLFDIFFAALIGNLKSEGRPIWLFLVGPPGCGKTLPMMTVQNSPFTYVVSAFRPAALISGWGMQGGQDVSLIPKLHGKVLMVKDMSSLLSQNRETVAEILGLLRDAYDGSCSKAFGTGVQRSYASRFGFIGATTPEIDANWAMNIRLGERFLRWRIKTPPEQIYEKIDRALSALSVEMKEEYKLETICLGYLKHLLRPEGKLPVLSMQLEIGRLAQLGAILRSGVSRAPFNNQVMVMPEWEEATRFAKQLAKMAISLAYIRGKDTNDAEEFEDIKAFVRDSIDGRVECICKLLYARPSLTTNDIAEQIHLPDWTVRQVLQDLEILRVLVRTTNGSFAVSYDIIPWIRGNLDQFQLWSSIDMKGIDNVSNTDNVTVQG
jgi:hypothetical protein